jgi:hypothetical protein
MGKEKQKKNTTNIVQVFGYETYRTSRFLHQKAFCDLKLGFAFYSLKVLPHIQLGRGTPVQEYIYISTDH